jgi:outer membrane protein assembly factor BamD
MLLRMILGAAVACAAVACDPCKKLAKSKSVADKDSAAHCYFSKKQYESAGILFEELMGLYRGTEKLEKTMFYFAKSKFHNAEFITSAYYFQEFVLQYPMGRFTEEATYLIAMSHFGMSNVHYLDQSDTYKAIEYMQLYLQRYPGGKYSADAEKHIADMRLKLALKAFRLADLYYRMENYKSAVVAFKNVLADHPQSPYREEAAFKLFKSAYLYALQSVKEKQAERYEMAETYYLRYMDRYGEGKFRREAESIYSDLRQHMSKLTIGAAQ